MTTLNDQLARIRDVLQDTDTSAARTGVLTEAHGEALRALGRLNLFTQITWVNAQQNVGLYTLADSVVEVIYVLYNQKALRWASEQTLDRMHPGWEFRAGNEPRYWTMDNQTRNTIKIIPAPMRTGSAVPVPGSPLFLPMEDNLVLFHTFDAALEVTDGGDTLPTLLDWDDLLMYATVAQMAGREGPFQNLPVATLTRTLEEFWKTALLTGDAYAS